MEKSRRGDRSPSLDDSQNVACKNIHRRWIGGSRIQSSEWLNMPSLPRHGAIDQEKKKVWERARLDDKTQNVGGGGEKKNQVVSFYRWFFFLPKILCYFFYNIIYLIQQNEIQKKKKENSTLFRNYCTKFISHIVFKL